MHHILKDILRDDYNSMDNWQRNAIEAVHCVLYMAEGIFAKED